MIIFVLLSIVSCGYGEWVEIPQSGERKLGIENPGRFAVRDLNKLKYEELAEIIGPGFEKEFSKFLQKHSHEMGENANELRGGNKTLERNMFYVDPWLKYDADHTQAPFITSEHPWIDSAKGNASDDYRIAPITTTTTIAPMKSSTITSVTTAKSRTNEKVTGKKAPVPGKNKETQTAATKEPPTRISNSTNKPILKRKTHRIKWIPYNPFSLNEILNFLRSIQNTFSMGSARGVTAKIQTLKTFKAELMQNIGNFLGALEAIPIIHSHKFSAYLEERLKQLWPTQTEKKKRAKRGMMDGGGGGHMDFPSAETALMTVSILTFAVFLIKLVLV